ARAPSSAAASAPEVRRLTLKPRREGPVRGGHPWIFSGAIAAGLEGAEPGEPVAVHAAGGRFLAAGYCNPQTPITVRVLTHEEEAIDAALVRRRLDEALALRQATLPAGLDAYRVLNGEGDRLPGVVVDRYGDFLVCQFLRAGAEPYDLIVLDPPPFVRRRRDLAPGLRGYKDVNLQALRRLAPGGWLLTSSCSQHLTRAGFREVVAAAAADAGRVAEMVAEWGHPPDHPVLLAHPEGEYLKVMLLRA